MSASYIVPPTAVGRIYGVAAVKIAAHKVYLLDEVGKIIGSRFYKTPYQVAGMEFADLVNFVRSEGENKTGWPIETCPDCLLRSVACPECGICPRGINYEGKQCGCGGTFVRKEFHVCCQRHHHHLGSTCPHCGQEG